MITYITETFDINDNNLLWEKFMCFMRLLLPWEEKQLIQLSYIQKIPVIAFIYSSEVMGDGHLQFLELYGEFIKKEDIIDAFKSLSISNKYIKNIEKLPTDFEPVPELVEKGLKDGVYHKEMKRIDEIYDVFDNCLYRYGNEEIDEKIIDYVHKHHLEFFSYK